MKREEYEYHLNKEQRIEFAEKRKKIFFVGKGKGMHGKKIKN